MPRSPSLVWVKALLVVVSTTATTSAQTSAPEHNTPTPITLEQALEKARGESPALRNAQAMLELARADQTRARTYPHNPQLSLTGADRSGGGDSTTDRGVEIGQEIEIGGQRGRRIAAAEALLLSAEEDFRYAELQLVNRVERAFARALAEERRVAIAASEQALVEHLLTFEERRLEAGAGTQLDLNLARAAAARGRQRVEVSLAQRAVVRADLAEVIGLDPARPLVPLTSERPARQELASLEALVARATASRPDLVARQRSVEAARRRVELERRKARPNLRASLFSRREEGDDILGGSIGIAIPLFDRNQGGIQAARAESAQAEAELDRTELAVRRSVVDAHARYVAAVNAVTSLESLVVGTLEESLELLETALEAGKVNAADVLVLRRELVEAQRLFVDAQLDLAEARSDLRLAVGAPISNTQADDSASGDS